MTERTHFADDATLAHIAKLGRENARMRGALEQFANNQLSDENCASVDVAAKRVRGIARAALKGD